jgi:hypothetical protein
MAVLKIKKDIEPTRNSKTHESEQNRDQSNEIVEALKLNNRWCQFLVPSVESSNSI